MKKLRVAFYPYGVEQENPYQNILINELRKTNIEVIPVPGAKIFPLFQVLKVKPDILHLFWPHDMYLGRTKLLSWVKQVMLVLTLPQLNKTTIVYSADNVYSHGANNIDMEIFWTSKILQKCKGIVFASNASREIFNKYYSLEHLWSVIITHPNYFSYYPNETTKIDSRGYLGVDEKMKVLLLLGRIDPYKGIEDILLSFTKVNEPESLLIIAGKCADSKYLKVIEGLVPSGMNCKVNIINTYIPPEELQYYFCASDAVFINYKDIPLNPGSLIMAMGFGAFVIAPNFPAIQELSEKDCSILYDPTEEGSLEKSIRQALKTIPNENCKRRIIENIQKRHDPEVNSMKLLTFYQSLI